MLDNGNAGAWRNVSERDGRDRDTVSQDKPSEREVYMTTHEVAHLLRLSEAGVRYRLRKGILPGINLGSDRAGWRISRRELDAWLDARRGPAGPGIER